MQFLIVFTVKNVNFFTINIKLKVILSSKSVCVCVGGGGDTFVQAIRPPKKSGGGGYIPIPPGFTPVSGSIGVKKTITTFAIFNR